MTLADNFLAFVAGFPRRARGDQFALRRLARSRRIRLQNEIRQATQFAYMGGGTGLCRVLGRYKMYVDTNDVGLSSHLMLDGYWEMWVTEVLVSRLGAGMTAVDVGANIGYFTMVMADMVGPTGAVHAFEPNPLIARRLAQSAHVNGFRERVTLHPEPLGAEEGGRHVLVVPDNYPGGAALVPAPDDAPEAEVLTMRRLDSYPELLDADIVKIDAEGAEEAIWRGMAGIFARGRPMTVVLEFTPGRYADPAAFLAAIAAEGFGLQFVSAATSLRRARPADILALPAQMDQMLVLTR